MVGATTVGGFSGVAGLATHEQFPRRCPRARPAQRSITHGVASLRERGAMGRFREGGATAVPHDSGVPPREPCGRTIRAFLLGCCTRKGRTPTSGRLWDQPWTGAWGPAMFHASLGPPYGPEREGPHRQLLGGLRGLLQSQSSQASRRFGFPRVHLIRGKEGARDLGFSTWFRGKLGRH